jgi:hypothetical protein
MPDSPIGLTGILKNYFGGVNMKKLIVFFLVLLTAGTMAFAQDSNWKLGGFLYSTMAYDINEKTWGSSEIIVDGQTTKFLYLSRLTADWKNTLRSGDIGFSAGLEMRADRDVGPNSNMPNVYARYVYGYSSFFDNKMLVKVGKVDDTTFNSGGRLSTDGGVGAGVMLQFAPITGLKFGGGAYMPVNGGSVEEALYSFGAVYELPRVFKISGAGSITKNELKMATAGVSLLAVNNLRAQAETLIYPMTPGDPHPMTAIDEILSYRINDLTFGIDMFQFINNANLFLGKGGGAPFNTASIPDTQSFKMGLSFDPYVQYQIGNFTPRMGFSFENYGVKDFTATRKEREQDRFIFTVKPSIAYRFGLVSQLTLGYVYTLQADKLTVGGTGNDPEITHNSKVTLTFFVYLP